MAVTENSAIATVQQGSGGIDSFLVTSVAAGNTYIDVTTVNNGFVREPVTVSNSGVIVSQRKRK